MPTASRRRVDTRGGLAVVVMRHPRADRQGPGSRALASGPVHEVGSHGDDAEHGQPGDHRLAEADEDVHADHRRGHGRERQVHVPPRAKSREKAKAAVGTETRAATAAAGTTMAGRFGRRPAQADEHQPADPDTDQAHQRDIGTERRDPAVRA